MPNGGQKMEEEPKEPSIPKTTVPSEVEIFPYLLEEPASPLAVELAVAFMITEVNREKGGGLIRKTPEEFITLFSKIGWPYWFMKTKEGSVIADGQGLSEQKLSFSQVPKPEEIDNILSSSETATDYINSLKRTIELSFIVYPIRRTMRTKKPVFLGKIGEKSSHSSSGTGSGPQGSRPQWLPVSPTRLQPHP